MGAFDRYYSRLVLFGLAGVVWFAAFFQAAHDLWAATAVFFWVTILSIIFCVGRFRDGKPLKFPLLGWLLLCLGTILLSGWHAYDRGAFKLDAWGWFFVAVIFYLFINGVETDDDLPLFYEAAGWVLVPLAVRCLWELSTGRVGFSSYTFNLDFLKAGLVVSMPYRTWEIHASLINSIVLAGFVLYWPLIFWEKIRQRRRFAILFFSSLVILLIAASWWSWVSLGIGYLSYYRKPLFSLWARHKEKRAYFIFLALFAISLMIGLKLHQSLDDGGAGRFDYWSAALASWRHHPWTGVGLGGYAIAFPFFKNAPVQNTLFAHNWPLQWLSETGCIGLAAVIMFFWNFLRFLRKQPNGTPYTSVLIAILCFSMLHLNMEYFLNKCLFMIVLGSALAHTELPMVGTKRLWVATGGIGFFLIVPFWANLFLASRLYMSGLYFEQQGETARAQRAYLEAISLDASQADSFKALSRMYWAVFQKTRSPEALAAAEQYLRQAFEFRKDPRFLKDLEAYRRANHQ